MLDDAVLDHLIAWLNAEGGTSLVGDFVAQGHPARIWASDRSGALEDSFDDLIRVLANGGHLTLLAALVLAVRAQASSAPPAEVEVALARALRDWDADRRQLDSEAPSFDVFVCYAHEDKDRIGLLVQTLRTEGLSVFLDTDCIQPGESIAASIAHAVGTCKAAVVVVSAAWCVSVWARREMSLLLAERVTGKCTILPVVIDDVPLPESVRDVFAVDLRGLSTLTNCGIIEARLRPLLDRIRGGRNGTRMLLQP